MCSLRHFGECSLPSPLLFIVANTAYEQVMAAQSDLVEAVGEVSPRILHMDARSKDRRSGSRRD